MALNLRLHILTSGIFSSGEVYAVGRSDYGRLGIFIKASGADISAVPEPHLVEGLLQGRKCCWVGCGEACSYAVDDAGMYVCSLWN